jgi:Domain of unknown function (DUF4389)
MATETMVYPARVGGQLDPGLSRWLWLLKWLLAIPHYIVLALLWIAFFFLTVVAFFAILFTGRYPRGIFDFNVGVLRWTWRVGFYAYAVNGTDRYPPFTLDEVDYPASLEVDYPERLSRGLVLVKWWLLAIPQYVVVGIFLGGWTWVLWSNGSHVFRYGGGLIGILVLIGVVALLFTGRYPQSIFDLVMGLNRWVVRVAAYATLMTDRYPPFRLDMGGSDPATVAAPPPAAPGTPAGETAAAAVAATGPASRRWTVGRIVLLVVGSIAALIGAALLAGGIAAVVVDQTQRDSAGFLVSPTRNFSTPTYAVVSRKLYAGVDGPDWVYDNLLGTVVLKSESSKPVFMGIARAADVDRYLGSVRRATVTDLSAHSNQYVVVGAGAPDAPPGDQKFWAAETSGAGSQSVQWDVQDGTWRVVVMNADSSRGVNADLRVGAELPNLVWLGIGLIVVGGGILGAGVFLIFLGARQRTPRPPPAAASEPGSLAT